ncbi:MAG: hypothetical protein AAB433_02430 [Nitrospirota bacterium]
MSPISNDLDVAVSPHSDLPPLTPKATLCAGLLIRVTGSLLQLSGKAIAFPTGPHPDRKGPLETRLAESLADLQAALEVFIETLSIPAQSLIERRIAKLNAFRRWGLSGLALLSDPPAVHWHGLGKLIEEAGELIELLSLLCSPACSDNSSLLPEISQHLLEEIGDVQAAMDYVIEANHLPAAHIQQRRHQSCCRYEDFVSTSPLVPSRSMEGITS